MEKNPGGDGVDPDAHLGEVDGEPGGEVGDGGLGAGVGGDLGEGGVGVHGADVHDVAALPAHHLAGEGLSGDQGADEVQVEDELHAGFIEVEEALGVRFDVAQLEIHLVRGGPGVVAAGAVQKDVAGAEVSLDLVGHGVADLLVEDVALVGLGDAALFYDLLGELVRRVVVEVQQRHLGAGPGEDLGEGGAEHAAGARDHGHLAGKIGIENVGHHKKNLLSVYGISVPKKRGGSPLFLLLHIL